MKPMMWNVVKAQQYQSKTVEQESWRHGHRA